MHAFTEKDFIAKACNPPSELSAGWSFCGLQVSAALPAADLSGCWLLEARSALRFVAPMALPSRTVARRQAVPPDGVLPTELPSELESVPSSPAAAPSARLRPVLIRPSWLPAAAQEAPRSAPPEEAPPRAVPPDPELPAAASPPRAPLPLLVSCCFYPKCRDFL